MLKTVMFAALASASLTAVPAVAAPLGAGSPDGAKIDMSAAPAPTAAPAREIRYCVISTITGSRIPQKECHTRKDWIQLTGQDPLAKTN